MFKKNYTGIPLSQEQRDAVNMSGLAPRLSNVSNRSEVSGSGGRAAAATSVNATLGILNIATNL